MLDFIADNYLWFIVLGAALLAIALILLFTRKKPVQEEVVTEQPLNTDVNTQVKEESPELVEVTGNTETLEIVDDVVEQGVAAAADAFDFEPVMPNDNQVVEEIKPAQVETQNVSEPIFEEKVEPIFEEVATETVATEPVVEEPVIENVSVENLEPVSSEEVLPVIDEVVDVPAVGDAVIPHDDVNKDNVPVNNGLDEDIWKF